MMNPIAFFYLGPEAEFFELGGEVVLLAGPALVRRRCVAEPGSIVVGCDPSHALADVDLLAFTDPLLPVDRSG